MKKHITILIACFFLVLICIYLFYSKQNTPAVSATNKVLTESVGSAMTTNKYDRDVQTATESSGSSIYAEISGAVLKPGVHKLNYGARFIDLLGAAGGFSLDTALSWSSRNLNLAQLVYDGQKIYIPFEWEASHYSDLVVRSYLPAPDGVVNFEDGSPANKNPEVADKTSLNTQTDDLSSAGSTETVNVNTETKDGIKKLSGVGDVYAAKIIENRPYTDFADFASRSGLSQNLSIKVKDFVTF